jgi:hypothetical protein
MSEQSIADDEDLSPARESLRREQSRARRVFHPLEDQKATAPTDMPWALSPRRAAELWGLNSGPRPGDGVRRRYPYSKT